MSKDNTEEKFEKLINNLEKEAVEIKELERQIALGWNRGFQFGLFIGIIGTLIAGFLIKILW